MTTDFVEESQQLEGAELRSALQERADQIRRDWPAGHTVEITTAGESGSAGKTSVGVTAGALFAEVGFTVELVDLDGQGNASKHLGIGVSERPDDNLLDLNLGYPAPPTIGDVLVRREVLIPGTDIWRVPSMDDIRRPAYNPTSLPGYGVILDPDDRAAAEAAEWLSRLSVYPNGTSYASGEPRTFYDDEALLAQDAYGALRLTRAMDAASTRPHIRIYDLHGTKSTTMYSVLFRVRRAMTSVTLDDKTTGPDLDNLLKTINGIVTEGVNPDLAMVMIVANRVDRPFTRLGRRMLNRLYQRHGDLVAPAVIRDAVTVSDAYWNREPLNLWVAKDKVTDDYRRVILWALERGGIFTP